MTTIQRRTKATRLALLAEFALQRLPMDLLQYIPA
jgi:hypothetical protein